MVAPVTGTHEDLEERASESGSVVMRDGNGHGSIVDREEQKSYAGQAIRIATFEVG